MERLIINIPEKKSTLVKQILKVLGVTIQPAAKSIPPTYKQNLTKVSIWSDDDLIIKSYANQAF